MTAPISLPPFIVEAVNETPTWMRVAAMLATTTTKDPAIRRAWIDHAEWGRGQHVRLWLLEDRAIVDGQVMRRWHLQTTPAAAWWWFRTAAKPAGHRIVLTEVTHV